MITGLFRIAHLHATAGSLTADPARQYRRTASGAEGQSADLKMAKVGERRPLSDRCEQVCGYIVATNFLASAVLHGKRLEVDPCGSTSSIPCAYVAWNTASLNFRSS